MTDAIELHDSRVEVDRRGAAVVLRLCPAYVHHWERVNGAWVGEGRSQVAEITLAEGRLKSRVDGAFGVTHGWIEIDGQRYSNMLPVPLAKAGATHGRLELFTAPPIEFSAAGVTIELLDGHEFIEPLPQEWAPDGGIG